MDPISTRVALGAAGAGGAAAGYEGYIAMAMNLNDPELIVYEFSYSTGWGARYTKSNNSSGAAGVAWNSTGDVIAVTGRNSPYLRAYAWNSPGFGSEYAQASNMPNQGNNYTLFFSPNDGALAYGRSSTRPEAKQWSNGFTNTAIFYPSVYSQSSQFRIAFSPDGNWIAATNDNNATTGLQAWSWSDSTGFGSTRYTLSSSPGGSLNGCAFTQDSSYVIAGSYPGSIRAWPWNAPGFGTAVSAPVTLPSPAPSPWSVDVHPNNDAVVISDASGSSPRIHAWEWTGSGFGAKYSNPVSVPSSWNVDTRFSPDGTLVCTTDENNQISMYQWDSSSGFGTKYSQPSVGLHERANQIAFQPLQP